MGLVDYLHASVRRAPEAIAVGVPGGASLSYAALDALSDRLRDRLWALGVRPGDRVGFRLHKSLDSVATIFGILKCGAAYVPVDAESPAARCAFILSDCQVKVVLTERRLAPGLRDELAALGAAPVILEIDEAHAGSGLPALLAGLDAGAPVATVPTHPAAPDDIAYLLYTSGSTGKPKGVVLTHRNACSFVDWCSGVFEPDARDVVSSHAPFHFDLSILDIYLAIKHGARLVLIGETLGKDPLQLAPVIASERISIWYSTPSILSLLANYGKLERHACPALRFVFFAGEVFPIPQFKALRELWPSPRYFNLYGPTETNVCTWYEVPADDSWQSMSTFPIGAVCPPNRLKVVDTDDSEVPAGSEGELLVAGPNVMVGYWNLPERNQKAFLVDGDGTPWYRTGDIVRQQPDGLYRYVSRRDRMVKRRGYRVELGEIEAGLARHPEILEAAAVAQVDEAAGVRVIAFVAPQAGRTLSIIGLKGYASKNLPPYMAPDAFVIVDALPRTSTDKINLQALQQLAATRGPRA